MWIRRINKVLKRFGYVLKRTGEAQRFPAATHQPAPSPANNIPVAVTPIPPHTQSELPAVVDKAIISLIELGDQRLAMGQAAVSQAKSRSQKKITRRWERVMQSKMDAKQPSCRGAAADVVVSRLAPRAALPVGISR